ncbi:neuronal acetylcholine receptor subunit alpha-10-like [Festucalex cinctus]
MKMKMVCGCYVVFLLLFLPVCQSAHGRYAHKLLSDLLANYTNALRPVADTDHVINVTLQVTLSQIIDMDERNQILTTYLWVRQVWMDAFLAWKKDDYDGLDTIRIPSSYVWRPDIVLYNSADDEFSSSMETNVVLRHDGQVMWDQPAITKSSCSVDVAFFPFDMQQCHLTFGSWTHNGNQMDLFNALDSADLADFIPNVEWEILGMPAKKNVILYGCCSDPYPDITFTLHLKRRSSFYIFNLLLPCMMISFLAPLGFYLPADSGEKVSLGVTVLLALTVFQLLVAESMPPSESVPLIGKYYIATMTMVTASTALTIFIMNIHHCGPEGRPVPAWAERFILKYLARVCFVYEAADERLSGPTSCKQPESDGNKCNGEARRPDKRKDDAFVALEEGGDPAGGEQSGGGSAENRKEACACHHHQGLCRNVEYIANAYQDQRAAQLRVGEWRKLAKVMDRFFMWLFFIMVFIMSVLILGKAV